MNSLEAKKKLHILVLAYSVSPVRGSEYSVGWNYVKRMSEVCDLTVLYGLAGSHMGDIDEISEMAEYEIGVGEVNFEPILPNIIARLLNFPNRRGVFPYSFYLAYRVWHFQAYRRAKKIIESRKIDAIHYLCPIGYREPGYLWKLNVPYVWGPVGGMPPTAQLAGAPRSWRSLVKTALKNLINTVQLRVSRRVPRALRAADVVIAATSENQRIIKERFNVNAYCFPENAIPDEWFSPVLSEEQERSDKTINLVWIGSLDSRKAPDLLIDVISNLEASNWHLHIIGNGPLAEVVKALAERRRVSSKITFHGLISRETVMEILKKSTLNLITSMAEGNPTVVWEAMAAGVPTITLDHNGMHDVICDNCGAKVPLGSYDQTARDFALALDLLIRNPQKISELRKGVIICRENYRWSNRTKTWLQIYSSAITKHGSRDK